MRMKGFDMTKLVLFEIEEKDTARKTTIRPEKIDAVLDQGFNVCVFSVGSQFVINPPAVLSGDEQSDWCHKKYEEIRSVMAGK